MGFDRRSQAEADEEGAIRPVIASLNAGLVPRADHTLDQPLERYTPGDHDLWRRLYARQSALLPGRVSNAFLDGLATLGLPADHIPAFDEINARLLPATGWQVVAVPGLVPDEVFFAHLAERRFPATWWMRPRDEIDYIAEPDVFHDVFGHTPLLINPVFADYLQAFGAAGLKALAHDALPYLARLYWYTVEFGLINGARGLRIYGAGIVSSKSESIYALESTSPNRVGFNLRRVMRTRYRIDTFQKTYFVITGFRELFAATQADLLPSYDAIRDLPSYGAGQLAARDIVLQRGDRSGWSDSEDV